MLVSGLRLRVMIVICSLCDYKRWSDNFELSDFASRYHNKPGYGPSEIFSTVASMSDSV